MKEIEKNILEYFHKHIGASVARGYLEYEIAYDLDGGYSKNAYKVSDCITDMVFRKVLKEEDYGYVSKISLVDK